MPARGAGEAVRVLQASELWLATCGRTLPATEQGPGSPDLLGSQRASAPLRVSLSVFAASDKHWGIDEYEVATQGLVSHHFEEIDGRLERSSTPFRYVWPAELDLMAELASMSLRERWGGWNREPYTGESRKHVSVWEKPE
jgi:hypothetical protein